MSPICCEHAHLANGPIAHTHDFQRLHRVSGRCVCAEIGKDLSGFGGGGHGVDASDWCGEAAHTSDPLLVHPGAYTLLKAVGLGACVQNCAWEEGGSRYF